MNKVKEFFQEKHTDNLNFNGLYEYIIENNIEIEFTNIRFSAIGFTSYDKVYISKSIPSYIDDNVLFMIICHEIGHFLRFRKKGLKFHLNNLSINDKEIFFEKLIHEEIIADKFSCLLFYHLNRFIYEGQMQDLHLTENVDKYKQQVDFLYQYYSSDENEYIKTINNFIFD